jgi:hypothetical protein
MTKKSIGELLAGDDEVDALKPRRARKAEAVPASPLDRVTIVLEENDNIPPTGQFFAINGKTFMLRPGEPAEVPRSIINVLEQAVQDVPQIDPTTRQVVGYRKRLRFPYRIVQLAAA